MEISLKVIVQVERKGETKMTETNKIKALEEKEKFQDRIIIIMGILIIGLFIFTTIDELIPDKNWEKEIETITNCESWHKVEDSFTEETVLDSLKDQKAITKKDKKVYIAMNEDNTFGIAYFDGPMGTNTFVTYDYNEKDHKAKARFAWY